MARPALREDGFSAIAHPTRRALLDHLRRGDSNVVALCRALEGLVPGTSQPAISEHLAVLERARLVGARREGRERVYALNADGMGDVVGWLAEYGAFWDDRLARFGDYLARRAKP